MSPRHREEVTDAHLRARDAAKADAGSGHSKSVALGLAIVGAFSGDLPLLGVAEMADIVRFSRSTAHRYMDTLTELGYLAQDGETRKYLIGRRGVDLGVRALSCFGLCGQHELLEGLRKRTSFTVALTALSHGGALIADVAYSRRAGQGELVLHIRKGGVLPLQRSAHGVALLSCLPDVKVGEALEAAQSRARAQTGGDEAGSIVELERWVERARSDGLAFEQGQRDGRVCALAAPVQRPEGEPVVAIGVIVRDAEGGGASLIDDLGAEVRRSAGALAAALPLPPPGWNERPAAQDDG